MKLYDTNITFAVRCASCGRIKFYGISIFELLQNKSKDIICQCGSPEMTITIKNNKEIIVNIPCIACDTDHTYKYKLKKILKNKLTVVCCGETGLELCFFGNGKDVRDVVSKYEQDLCLLMDELGLSGFLT